MNIQKKDDPGVMTGEKKTSIGLALVKEWRKKCPKSKIEEARKIADAKWQMILQEREQRKESKNSIKG